MKNKKLIALVCCMALLVGAVGATLAWLTDQTGEVKNTFTVGNINIDLAETPNQIYKMVPGDTIYKDPVVTVKANSEPCWVFVKVTESTNKDFDAYLDYHKDDNGNILWANGWTVLDSASTGDEYVLYRTVDAIPDEDLAYGVLKDNEVLVLDTVTKSMMDEIDGVVAEDAEEDAADAEIALRPTLTFKAYAIQQAHFATVEAAWAEACK